ncbi:MAG: hypothetical protein ACHREM_04230 [Polyangiales bacterium]
MITGLMFEVKSEELKTHCIAQMNAHEMKVRDYEGNIEGVRKLQADAGQTSRNALDDLTKRMNEHKSRVQYFRFCAEHVIPNEVYRLSESDLSTIGFVVRYFG